MAFKDENEFEVGDPEDEFRTRPFSRESDMESPGEESSDDEEELSEEELVQWKDEFPEYTAEELEEKIPKSPRASRMALVGSGVFGTLLGTVVAGVLVDDQPGPQQARAFFFFLLVLAPLFSCLWHWLFYLRGQRVAQKMKEEEQEAKPAGSEPILPNEELQQANTAGSEPIHPK